MPVGSIYQIGVKLTHASVQVDVKTGIRPRGGSARQIGHILAQFISARLKPGAEKEG
ncbi:MAG TPA: hypothetical protein VHO71_05035 [Caproiciproducens sp.]|nr:hypothetical protein [Caproiciproducens sp.]